MSLFNSGIRPAIDAHLLAEAAKVRDYGDYWSASSAGYCMRKLIFERLGVPHSTEDDPRKQRVFTAGHIFHDWIQGLTKDAGLSIAQEVELQDEDLMVRGHFDDLVLVNDWAEIQVGEVSHEVASRPTDSKRLILYDYKTVNSRSFTYAKANGNKMSHYHKLQLATYMYMLRKGDNLRGRKWSEDLGESLNLALKQIPNLTEARILKISKDDLRMEEQQLLWTLELEAEVVAYWTTLNKYWVDKKIPPCTCADHEGGFMSREKFNPYYFNGEPCSIEWYKQHKETSNVK